MSEKTFEERLIKLDNEMIYSYKAVSSGVFNKGRYYDFYHKHEMETAKSYVESLQNYKIDNITQAAIDYKIEANNSTVELFRLTVVFNNEVK